MAEAMEEMAEPDDDGGGLVAMSLRTVSRHGYAQNVLRVIGAIICWPLWGWRAQQLPDGTVIWTLPGDQTTTPGSAAVPGAVHPHRHHLDLTRPAPTAAGSAPR